jgi:hypothetical protein
MSRYGGWLILSSLVAVVGCTPPSLSGHAPDQPPSPSSSDVPNRAEALLVVDCLLPGQVRKLGRMTFLTARRPMKTSAQDCEIRGGEYVGGENHSRNSLKIGS